MWCGRVYNKINDFAHVPRNHLHRKTRNVDIKTLKLDGYEQRNMYSYERRKLYSYEKRNSYEKPINTLATNNVFYMITKNGSLYGYEHRVFIWLRQTVFYMATNNGFLDGYEKRKSL